MHWGFVKKELESEINRISDREYIEALSLEEGLTVSKTVKIAFSVGFKSTLYLSLSETEFNEICKILNKRGL